jgi:PAS domain S-box-containing protein
MDHDENNMDYLEKRNQYLEEVSRFTLDALEMAASLGDFQTSINKLQDPSVILDETRARIERLIQFSGTAFYLVDEDDSDFFPTSVQPQSMKTYIQDEVEWLIEQGTWAWALWERRPVILSSKKQDSQLVLHIMATSSRTRGMFVGILSKDKTDIPDISLSLLSIILLNSSNALESFELYSMIRKINETLEKRENYRVLFEAAPDGVEVLDARGNIVDCNKTQEVLLHCSRDEIVGSHTTDFFPHSSKAGYDNNLALLKDNGYLEGEAELTARNGMIIPVWRKEKAIYDEGHNFVGSVVYNHDMSAIRRAEQEKESLLTQLQRAQKMEALGTLAGGVAHDLNNILGGLVSYPELLLMQLPAESPLRKPILTIQKSGEKAAAIVQDLLTLARRGVSTTEVVNLNEVISDYLKTPEHQRLELTHPNIRFKTHLADDLLNIMGSPVHLSKTLMNLVSNAAEAIPDTGIVFISTMNLYVDRPIRGYDDLKEGDYVIFEVSDTGTGIPPTDLERIFEPFYTRKVMGRSGTGLGLAVVWGTVKDHNGYIDVQSSPEAGTVFRLYFPVVRKEVSKTVADRPAEAYSGNGEAILVVDDMEEQREIACQILTKLGYRPHCVSSGEEAVAYLKSRSVDLVVLDMIMQPGMDGLETYKRITGLHPGQKAILVSGYSETDRVLEAQEYGAGAYVKKPFHFETLGLAVKTELAR